MQVHFDHPLEFFSKIATIWQGTLAPSVKFERVPISFRIAGDPSSLEVKVIVCRKRCAWYVDVIQLTPR